MRRQLDKFLAANPNYHGISLDFEEVPEDAQAGYQALMAELYADFSRKNLRLYINMPTGTDKKMLAFEAAHTDGIVLMNYDQHENTSEPGPIAAEDWFENNLQRVLQIVPKQRLICAIGNYAYNWTVPLPDTKGHTSKKVLNLSLREACRRRGRRRAMRKPDLSFAGDELNPHFAYDDEDEHVRHQVWLLDAVTALNEMRAARAAGHPDLRAVAARHGRSFALEDLGQAQHAERSRRRLKKCRPATTSNQKAKATSCASPAAAAGLAHHRHGRTTNQTATR